MKKSHEPMAEPSVKPRARFQFELRHLIYATVLLAASLGLFGVWGIVATFLALLFWRDVLTKLRKSVLNAAKATADKETPKSPGLLAITVRELLVLIVIVGILIALLLPAVSRRRSWDHLYLVRGALEAYHQTHGSLPPAYLADDEGRPAHSWRVLILPELGYQALYDQYRFDEPWNSPHNQELLNQTPREYERDERHSIFGRAQPLEPGMTPYLAVTGKGTVWPGATPRTLAELPDSLDWTALIIEAEFQPVPWTKPDDFSIEEVSRLVDPPDSVEDGHWTRSFLWSTFQGHQAIWADYDIEFLPPCEAAQLEELLTADDGKPGKEAEHLDTKRPAAWRRIHYTNIARLIIFLFVAAWPFRWIRPTVEIPREFQ